MIKYYNWVASKIGIYFSIFLKVGIQDQGVSGFGLFQDPHLCHTDYLLHRVPSHGLFLYILALCLAIFSLVISMLVKCTRTHFESFI